MAYLEQSVGVVDAEYSPIVTPSPINVESNSSSDSEPEMPDWMSLSHSEALNKLCIHADSVIEFDSVSLNGFWQSDVMHSSYEMLAPTWLQ
eukprot:2252081-Amphidinium_carterae.1